MQMKYLGTDSNDFLNGFFRENGIWVSDGAQDIATKFSEEEQEALYALEDTSWWHIINRVIHTIAMQIKTHMIYRVDIPDFIA